MKKKMNDELIRMFNIPTAPDTISHEFTGLNDEYKRCESICMDSDSWGFNHQCNLKAEHENDHAYGIDSCLWYLLDGVEQCKGDDHIGNCSVCWVREVRER